MLMKEIKPDDMNFEQALEALEEASESLRSGRLALDESISVYEKSIMLYNRCRKILDEAVQRVEIYRPQTDDTEGFEL